jgi:hypothetical protein
LAETEATEPRKWLRVEVVKVESAGVRLMG